MGATGGATGGDDGGRLRGIFFDEDTARAVAARLRRDGYDADVRREALAGEDDDEDHPWAVVTDAPEPLLDLLVDEHDGWLDHDLPDPTRVELRDLPPLPLAPKRFKRP